MESDIFEILNEIGYSKTSAGKRAKLYDNAGKGVSIFERRNFGGNFDIIIGGSRGDGTGVYLDCDVDKIFVQNEVRCFQKNDWSVEARLPLKTVFELETESTPSGYAKLRLQHMAEKDGTECVGEKLHQNIQQALESINGNFYLRNDRTLCSAIGPQPSRETKSWLQQNIKFSEIRSGPSEPYNILIPLVENYIELDEVVAFRCSCSSIMTAWCERVRHHDWPSGDMVEKIKIQDAYAVPVGIKGHKEEYLQWRLCFTLAEITLVQSFNDTQVKLYAMLKLVAKQYLKPICNSMTTYIIKNILFWLIERNPHLWDKEHLNERLHDALNHLKTSIENSELLNYMIPSRNLLQNKITPQQKHGLVSKINCLLSEGVSAVFRCQGIREIITLDANQRKEILKQRQAREEVVLAIFSHPPELVADILRNLFEAQTEAAVTSIFSDDIFSYVRKHNPFDYFRQITSMDSLAMYKACSFPSCVLV